MILHLQGRQPETHQRRGVFGSRATFRYGALTFARSRQDFPCGKESGAYTFEPGNHVLKCLKHILCNL